MERIRLYKKPAEADFFSIYTTFNGQRRIHVHGYNYKSSNKEYENDDNPDGHYWAMTEVSGFDVPLEEFIKEFSERNTEYTDEMYGECHQYQEDLDDEAAVEAMNHYFDGHAADAFLDFGKVAMDTPDGTYIQENSLFVKYEEIGNVEMNELYNDVIKATDRVQSTIAVLRFMQKPPISGNLDADLEELRCRALDLAEAMKTVFKQF